MTIISPMTSGGRADHSAAAAHDHHADPGDLVDLARRLEPGERERLEGIIAYTQRHIRPQSIEAWNTERFPHELLPALGRLGMGELFCDGSSPLLQGLAHAALARADVSLSALVGIHNELIVGTIDALGSDEQKETWLPRLRRLEALGAFAMTEPDHGSDIARGLQTTATPTESGWRINGAKRWVGAGTIADIALIWARDASDGEVKCFLVPTETLGYSATMIQHKTGLRIMHNADITLDEVEVPTGALLPGATSFASANTLLRASRAWVGWQAVGAQQALLDVALQYSKTREQFGTPLAAFQATQLTLGRIAGNLAVSSGFMAELCALQSEGLLTMTRASLAKATLTRMARESAASAREILGGNGLLGEHEAAKVAADIEAIYTYEGTHLINLLIVGRDLTGISAFTAS